MLDFATQGQQGLDLALNNHYDLLILDLNLPVMDGLVVCQQVRTKSTRHIPILMLTARDSIDDKVSGFTVGADDYLTKPFSLDEVMARVRALLRRKDTFSPAVLEIGPIKIDPARKEVQINDEVVEFTAKEYGLLEYFARNVGTVLTRTQLSEHVWDINFEPTSNVVDVYVGYLRTKISKTLGHSLIKTVRGHGYMLDIEQGQLESMPHVETSSTLNSELSQ